MLGRRGREPLTSESLKFEYRTMQGDFTQYSNSHRMVDGD
jgi:hypothetical protein